jgi:glycosyltransferase involved in cell wall biosynthesis
MNLADITVLVLTYNEEANIERTLAGLRWASRIVVVDSGSTDGTLKLLARQPRVTVYHRSFDTHARQWTFGLRETGISSGWILALDADYRLPDELVLELGRLDPSPNVAGYRARFIYAIDGKPLRGSLYPSAVVLFRHDQAEYFQDGHTQRLRVRGGVVELHSAIWHDDRKSFSQWRNAQLRYMALEAGKLRATPLPDLSWPDRARRLLLGPLLVLPYCLFLKGLILDGMAGLKYTYQRVYAEVLLARALVTMRA